MSDRSTTLNGRGLLCILITLFCWSSVPLFLKYFADYIDGWTANGWRYGVSALFWVPVLIIGTVRGRLPAGLWRAALVPAVANCVGQCCFAWAPYYINPGLQTFLLRLQIIFIAVGTYLIFPGERALLRSPTYWTGLMVVFAGSVGIILLNPNLSSRHTTQGVILALAGGAGFAAYSLAVRHYMHRFHPVFAFAAISSYTAAALVVVMLLLGARRGAAVFDLSGRQACLLFASAMLGIALSHVLYYAALNRLGVAVSSGVILLQPVIVSIGSYFLFHERLTTGQWSSGLTAIVGAGIMLFAQHRLGGAKVRAEKAAVEDGRLNQGGFPIRAASAESPGELTASSLPPAGT